MVSDQELLTLVEQLLRQAGPAAAANIPGIVRHLETKLGLDLSSKTALIRDQIELLFSPPPKDHFALNPFAQYFPATHHHQIPSAPANLSAFSHLPQHHELGFRYAPRPINVAAMEAAAAHHQHAMEAAAAAAHQHHRQQLRRPEQDQPQQPLHRPEQDHPHQQHQQHQQLHRAEHEQDRGHDRPCQLQPHSREAEQEQHQKQLQLAEPKEEDHQQQHGHKQEQEHPQQQLDHAEQDLQNSQPPQQLQPTATVAAVTVAARSTAKEGASTGVKRRGGPGGLNKICRVTPELQAIVGEPTMARTEIVKQLWAYIRKHNLQDPNNKRKIICNDELRLLFETDCTDMFKMNKLLAKHIITLEPTKNSGPDLKKLKATPEVISATEHDSSQDPVAISGPLAIFFGTEEREMLQAEVSTRVWDYIKSNHLEDPMNPMVVLCDSKLQQLFGVESLSAFGIQDMLMRHLFKQSNADSIN